MASKPKFSVRFTRPAKHDLKRLDRQYQEQVRDAINQLENEPRPLNSMTLTGDDGYVRVRTGDYRIVYRIDYTRHEIYITKIAHRKDAYR